MNKSACWKNRNKTMHYIQYFENEWNEPHINYFSQIGNIQNVKIYMPEGYCIYIHYERILQCINDEIFRLFRGSNSTFWYASPYTLNEQIEFLNKPTDIIINICRKTPCKFGCIINKCGETQTIHIEDTCNNMRIMWCDVCEMHVERQVKLLFIMSMHEQVNAKTYDKQKITLVERVFADSFLAKMIEKY